MHRKKWAQKKGDMDLFLYVVYLPGLPPLCDIASPAFTANTIKPETHRRTACLYKV